MDELTNAPIEEGNAQPVENTALPLPSTPPSVQVFDFSDPGKPLDKLESLLKTRKQLYDDWQQASKPYRMDLTPPDYRQRINDLKLAYDKADADVKSELKNLEPVMGKIKDKLLSYDLKDYTTQAPSGVVEPNKEAIIKASRLYTQLYGGNEMVQHELEKMFSSAVYAESIKPEIEKEFQRQVEETKKAIPDFFSDVSKDKIQEETKNMMANALAKNKAELEDVNQKVNAFKTEIEPMYQSAIANINDKYLQDYNTVLQNVAAQRSQDDNATLQSVQENYQKQVQEGSITQEEANSKIKAFMREKAVMNTSSASSIEHEAQKVFQQTMAPKYSEELTQIVNERTLMARNLNMQVNQVKEKVNNDYRLMADKFKRSLEADANLNERKLKILWQRAADNVLAQREQKEKTYQKFRYAISNELPGVPGLGASSIFYDKTAEALGGAIEDMGQYLRSIGVSSPFFDDLLIGKGAKMSIEHRLYQPDFGWKNLFDINYLASNTGNVAGSALPTIGIAALTEGNSLLTNTFSVLFNSAINAGDTYKEAIDGGDSEEMASQKAHKMFMLDTLTAPLQMADNMIYTSFFKKGGIKLAEMGIGAAAEAGQEAIETPLQSSIVENVPFSKEFFTKPTLEAATQALIGTLSLGGAMHVMNKITTFKKAPAMDIQWVMDNLKKMKPENLKAYAEMKFTQGEIDEKQLQDFNNTVDIVAKKIEDTKKINLPDTEAQHAVAVSSEIEQLRNTEVSDPAIKKTIDQQVKDKEKQLLDITKGDAPVATIEAAGRTFVGDPKEIVDEVTSDVKSLEAVKNGEVKITVQNDEEAAQKLQNAIEPNISSPNTNDNAIQEQSTTEGVLRDQGIQRESELQGVGGENQSENTPQEGEKTQVDKVDHTERDELAQEIASLPGNGSMIQASRNFALTNPDEVLKSIYQQASDPGTESATREMFGSELVDKILAYGDKQPSFAQAGFVRVDGKSYKGYTSKEQINNDISLVTGTLQGQKAPLTEEAKHKKAKIVEAKLRDAKNTGVISEEEKLNYEDKISKWRIDHPLQSEAIPNEQGAPNEAMPTASADQVAPTTPEQTNTAKAKSIADKIREHVKNVGKDAAFEGMLGIPVAIYKGALLAAANVIEAGGKIADAIQAAVEHWKEATPAQQGKFKDYLDKLFGEQGEFAMPEQEDTQNFTFTSKQLFSQLFRKQFYNRRVGEKTMAKAIRDAQDYIAKYFKENGIDMRKATVKRLLKKLNILTRLTNQAEVLNDVLEEIDALVLQEQNHQLVQDTKESLKKLKKLKKSAYLTQTDVSFLKSLAQTAPTPRAVLLAMGEAGLKSYYSLIGNLREAFTGKQSRVAKEQILAALNSVNERIDAYKQAKLEEKVRDMIDEGELPAGTTVEQYLESIEKPVEEKEKDNSARLEMEDFVKEQLDSLADHVPDTTNQADIIEKLLNIDLKGLSTPDLKLLNNIINNIINDNDYSASLKLVSKYITAPDIVSKIKELVVKRVTNKILFFKELAATKNFDNLLNSLFYNAESRRKFRGTFWTPFESSVARSILKLEAIGKELDVISKKAKVTQEENAGLNIYLHLRQLSIGTEEEMSAEFNESLKNIIQNSVERLYADGAKLGDIKGKEYMRQAKETAKALQSMGLIDGFTSDDNQLLVAEKDNVSHRDLKLMDPKLQPIVDFMDEKFADNAEAFLFYSNAIYDTGATPILGYFPRVVRALPSTIDASDTGGMASLDIHGEYKPKLSKQPLDRSRKRTGIGEGKYYRMDAISNFMEGMYQSLLLTEGKSAMMDIANTMGRKDFQQFIKGEHNPKPIIALDNYGQFRSAVEEIMGAKKHQPFSFINTSPRYEVVANWFLSKMVRTYLNRVDQIAGQYIPGLIANMTHVKINAFAYALKMQSKFVANPDYREAFNTLFSNSTLSHRITQGMPLLERSYNKLMTVPDSDASYKEKTLHDVKEGAKAVDEFLNDVSSWSLHKADYASSFTGAVSGYIDSLIKQGIIKNASEFDVFKEAKNPNAEALAAAEGVSAYINSSSDKSYMASVLKGGSEADPAMRQTIRNLIKYLYFLKPFNLNGFKNFLNEANIVSSYLTKKVSAIRKPAGYAEGVATKEDALEAMAHMSGYVSQSMAYQLIRVMVGTLFYKMGDQFLKALYDELPDASESDEDKKKRQQKFFAQLWASVASDVLLGGAPAGAEETIKSLGNDAWSWYAENKREDMKKEHQSAKGTIYDPMYNMFYSSEGIGAAGAYADYVNIVKEILKDDDIKDPVLKKAMKDLDWAALAPVILNSGDLRKLRNEMAKRLRFIKSKTEHNSKKSFGGGFGGGFKTGFGGGFK